MIEYISGKMVVKNPAFVVIDINGLAFHINISLNTYEKIQHLENAKILIYLAIKEDSHSLYGFFDDSERILFRNLLSVSGIGTNTAMVILSSFKTSDLLNAIISGNISLLKSVKGVGPKTAQRIVIDLQDTLKKKSGDQAMYMAVPDVTFDEATSALTMLGFKKSEAEKVVMKVIKENPDITTVENIIKLSLKSINH